MPILPDILDEMNRLIEAARANSILLRAICGLAVRIKSGDIQKFFTREYRDLDFVADSDRKRIESFFLEMGYESNKRFNLLNGAKRQIYLDPNSERHVDVFVRNFEMCHKLPMNDRLHLDPITVPLADMLLSKAQIVELNQRMPSISLRFFSTMKRGRMMPARSIWITSPNYVDRIGVCTKQHP